MAIQGNAFRRNTKSVPSNGVCGTRVDAAARIRGRARQPAVSSKLRDEYRTPSLPGQLGRPGDLPRGEVRIPVKCQNEPARRYLADEIGEQWLTIIGTEVNAPGVSPIGIRRPRRLEDEPFLIVPDQQRRDHANGSDN